MDSIGAIGLTAHIGIGERIFVSAFHLLGMSGDPHEA
jgi:hypothetical protein